MASIKKYKIARRLGAGVFEKTQTQKFLLSEQKRSKSKTARPKRPTDYGMSLIQKQRVRFAYGVSEKQFRSYVEKAMASAKLGGVPADVLFRLLETRLDNILYRAGFAKTRAFARQLASHGHMAINARKNDIPSAQLRSGDVVSVREGSKQKTVFANLSQQLEQTKVPAWLEVDPQKGTVKVTGEPKNPDAFFNFQAVIEFYSR
jgi:small subunit ribosomal protein S4